MNVIQVRKVNAPLTPNLEDYKLKNKSRSKRKAAAILPTNPPTPKLPKTHVHLKPTSDKHLEAKEQPAFCPLHPDRPATRYIDPKTKQRLCTKCFVLSNQEERCPNQIQSEKRRDLQQFRGKIKGFGLKIEQAEECIREGDYLGEQNYFKQKEYIQESFESLRGQLDEKQRELMSTLMSCQQQIKRTLARGGTEVEQMKKSINRYIEDIENNYEDIIEALSYEQFNEIIQRYNQKIVFFQGKIEGICVESNLNVYIPRKELERYIARAAVQVYPEPQPDDPNHTKDRTLQWYPTEKHNLYLEGTAKGYLSHHQESANNNKISQHRQSRDREHFYGGRVSSKQNNHHHNYDHHIFH